MSSEELSAVIRRLEKIHAELLEDLCLGAHGARNDLRDVIAELKGKLQ